METELTKQDILELFDKQAKSIEKQSKAIQEQSESFDELLRESQTDFDKRMKESQLDFDKRMKRSQLDFDKRLGQLAGTWGKFVTEMVKPKIVELFKEKGIEIETIVQSVEGYKNGKKYYEIDLLLINSDVAVVVEVKSSLSVEDVNEHLERLEKIQKVTPKRIDLSGVTIFGAVAGMIVEQDADRFAYKKGLYVLRQKGNIVEIVNDPSFKPKEWKVQY